ncbi:MAG: TerB family tellurite resistance protein [Planctomycetes bacterium]|nr:TerB family tellurite resistance protein [Planctomycetota bacterium]
MADAKFVMDMAKLIIAAAWADGELQAEEINSLKDLIFSLGDITEGDWAQLDVYTDSPVSADERDQLLARVLDHIRSQGDKEFVTGALKRLVEADGVVSAEEAKFLESVSEVVENADTGLGAMLSRLLKPTINRRKDTFLAGTQREKHIDDFIKNTIYYDIKTQTPELAAKIDIPEHKLRQLCLAAGLLARVAWVDADISDEEKKTIATVLSKSWGLSKLQARLVADISCARAMKGLDYYRLARSFFECTTLDARRSFLKCLFAVANASEKTSHDEVEEIRRIAESLKLQHKDFIAAKITISDEDLGLT